MTAGGAGAGGQPDPDSFLNELEEALQNAVDQEQFEEAAQARQRLQEFMLERGDVNGVLNVNREFYEAFSNGDAERMAAIWHKDDHVCCVHAGHKPLRGYERVMTAFAAQFRAVRSLTVNADDVRVTVRGTTAWVLCTQHMRHAPTGSHRALMATNIFRCTKGRWQLVHHHAGFLKPSSGLGGVLGGGLGAEEGAGTAGGIRIIDASGMGGGPSGLDEISGLLGQVMGGGGGGAAAHILATSSADDSLLLGDEDATIDELCRSTLRLVCELAREKQISARQKRALVTDVIEHEGDETPAYIVRAFKLLCLNKNGELVSDEFAREEFLMQCKLEARRLLAQEQGRQRSGSSRDDSDDDDIADTLLD